ncbi:cathepsin O isoform X2 [Morone saxatilis]|uniref:cathepsin O isoform X2 n=1 Tax=Morone saxatilis TaxID=34816 RepID=UPI0015E1FBD7|nr:cathepsin O isoform X2 [Morone saxatilis]
MRGVHLYLAVTAAVFALLSARCCLNVSSDETRTELNGCAVDFISFTEQFHRSYVANSEEFDLRHLCFQVRDTREGEWRETVTLWTFFRTYHNNKRRRTSLQATPTHNATKRHAYLNSFSTVAQSAKYGINQFSDFSQEEFRDLYLGASADRALLFPGLKTGKTEGLPAKFDWRDKAVVAPVQNQQACGSCWAFSVVGAVQSVHAIDGSQLVELSVQQVVDCSFQNEGCNGGSPVQALKWLKQSKMKLVPQSEYPYKAKTGICHFFSQSHGVVAVKNFTAYDFSGQEEAMMGHLVEHGPLAAIVDAVSWQDYLGGIIQHHCSSQRSNHAVLVVGYNTTGDIPYWIVQNSWGTTWGNEGYVYIKIGSNVCGIADSVAAVFL